MAHSSAWRHTLIKTHTPSEPGDPGGAPAFPCCDSLRVRRLLSSHVSLHAWFSFFSRHALCFSFAVGHLTYTNNFTSNETQRVKVKLEGLRGRSTSTLPQMEVKCEPAGTSCGQLASCFPTVHFLVGSVCPLLSRSVCLIPSACCQRERGNRSHIAAMCFQ